MEDPPRVIGGDPVELRDRYTVLDLVGQGSFGTVAAGVDRETGKNLAIKHIHPMAHTPCRARHILREVTVMRILQHYPNIISLEHVHVDAKSDSLYIVMELMECDLQRVLASRQVLTGEHVKVLLKQLLLGVQAMHKHGIIHRDIKPANILVLSDCQLRITDFGLARRIKSQPSDKKENDPAGDLNLTGYVCTRWYRSPEVMLGPEGGYATPVDMWSVGCILGEMLGSKGALFPGKNYIDQVSLTLATLGKPGKEWADALGYDLSNDALRFLKSVNFSKGRPLDSLVPPNVAKDAFQLLLKMLDLNTQRRLTATQALGHAFLAICPAIPTTTAAAADVSAENGTAKKETPTRPTTERANDFRFENTALTLPQLRALIAEEAALYGKSKRGSCRNTRGDVEGISQELASSLSLQDVIDVARKIVRQGKEGGGEEEHDGPGGAWDGAITAGASREPEDPTQARGAHTTSDPSSMGNLVGANEGGGDGVNGRPESAESLDQEGNDRLVGSGVKLECAGVGRGPEDEGKLREGELRGQCRDKLDSRSGNRMLVGEVDVCNGGLGGSGKINTSGQGIRVLANDRLETGAGRSSEEPRDLSGRNFGGIVGGVGGSKEDGGQVDLAEGSDLQGHMRALEGERTECPPDGSVDPTAVLGKSAIAVNSGRCARDVVGGQVGGNDVPINDTDKPAEGADRSSAEKKAGEISPALLLLADDPVGEQATSWQTRGRRESDDRPPELQALNRGRGYKVKPNKRRTEQRSCDEQSSLLLSERNDEQMRSGWAAVTIQACARRMAGSLRVAAIRRGTQPSQDVLINAITDGPQPRKPPQLVPMLPLASMVIPPSSADDNVEGAAAAAAAAAASKAPREPLAILRRLKDRPEDQPKVKTDQFRLRVTTRSAIEAHVRKTGALRRKVRPLPTPPSWRSATTAVKHSRGQQPRSARRGPLMQPRAVSPLHRSVTQLNWFVSAASRNGAGGGG